MEHYDNSASGYLEDAFEGLNAEFTDVETLRTSETNFVARAKRFGRWWLLKGLRKEVAGETLYRQRLRKELEIGMSLSHSGIVSFAGFESVGDLGECIIMEYVDGTTLDEWLQTKPSRKERRRIVEELLDAVEYLHRKNIVHRDIKPQNLLVTRNGQHLKLIDFGLADTDSHAVLKQPAGTPHYMAPEQNFTYEADSRNDIFSIGKVVAEMQTGYDSIVRKCVRSIDRRYQDISQIRRDIDRRKRRGRLFALTVIGILLTALLTAVVLLSRNMQQERQRANDLSNQQEQRLHEQQQKTALLGDSLKKLVAENKSFNAEKRAEEERRQTVNRVVENGVREADRLLQSSQLPQHIDTLSSFAYLRRDFSQVVQQLYADNRHYALKASEGFREEEKFFIQNSIEERMSHNIDRLIRKLNNLGGTNSPSEP